MEEIFFSLRESSGLSIYHRDSGGQTSDNFAGIDKYASAFEHRFVKYSSGVTMASVARVAKVATSTVSKALREDPTIPVTRRREIQQIAKRLGYRPMPPTVRGGSGCRKGDARLARQQVHGAGAPVVLVLSARSC